MDIETLSRLYFHQFTFGCDKITCQNNFCARSHRFVFANISDTNQLKLISRNFAEKHGSDPHLCSEISETSLSPEFISNQNEFTNFAQKFVNIFHTLNFSHPNESSQSRNKQNSPHAQNLQNDQMNLTFAKVNQQHQNDDQNSKTNIDFENPKPNSKTISSPDPNKIYTKDLIVSLRRVFGDIESFSSMLKENNDFPLSISNPNIDDDFLYEFSSKISSIPHISAALLDCVNNIAQKLIHMNNFKNQNRNSSLNQTQNLNQSNIRISIFNIPININYNIINPQSDQQVERNNIQYNQTLQTNDNSSTNQGNFAHPLKRFSSLRALLLLFYFPSVISPQCSFTILDPLLKIFASLPEESTKVVLSWIAQLHNLRKQIIGACHFSISMYFATKNPPEVHSDHIKNTLDAMSVIHEANSFSEKPFQPSVFYNHHIDETIDLQQELDYRMNRNDHYASILSRPFILSLKSKANLCQLESQQLMSIMAFRTFILNAMNSDMRTSSNDLFLTLYIRRSHLVEDAVEQLSRQNHYSFLKKLKVVFEGESAVDVGGPSREFLYLISESLFSPDYGMFIFVNHNKYNWFSQCSFENERSFFLVGAIIGLAIHNSIVLPIRFPIVVYKRLLTPSKQLTIVDLAQVDPELSNSLKQVIEMHLRGEDVSQLCLTFSATIDNFDQKINVPLLEGIEMDLEVDNDNVLLYVESYVNFVLSSSIQSQFEAFRKGFEFTCRVPSYKLLDPEEMDILVSGEEVLDWGALQRCATYSGGYTSKSRAVKWFWELFQKLSNEEKLKFLKFATGTDRAPVGGLGKLKLVIQRGADPSRLPISHTCFNTFTLPDYRSKRVLEERVMMAIEQNEGFGIV
ncbi:ubiquitin ligase [Tritrichomonas foetus]|uniref:HECT-type E3 ubiquitin transferase n=1 Tax=Tritrichomonas foetus TaxID=1144522 RepID=A0A1J4KUV7_9EUKA|nr:ubiquitin ligase [Tritrichomonas foetus]|eukprot:OHT13462.1 ubiquitin ligase [Tritrichomonas foetus]